MNMDLQWRKSSHSDNLGGNCVELMGLPDVIALRDSKDPDGPRLTLDRGAFSALLERLKRR
ncbi:DUF397 domain-containing protein [Actinomadura viridis]|uniref:DUF397 domain-containing protein n=1 Tax=Actinomadura viridis TaxID=58110 RepID=UPI0036CF469B